MDLVGIGLFTGFGLMAVALVGYAHAVSKLPPPNQRDDDDNDDPPIIIVV
jgi:hypothetical protein